MILHQAWQEHRTDWQTYVRSMPAVWKRFLYLVLLLTAMGFISHGTQDLYPTFLQQQRHFTPSQVAVTTMLSMVGAIIGGLVIGRASDWFGRRRAMIGGALGALVVIPLWVLAPSSALIVSRASRSIALTTAARMAASLSAGDATFMP